MKLTLKKTIFNLPDGRRLYGPRQALGSLYKEFIIEDRVYCFHLLSANAETFEYKLTRTRHKEIWDHNLKGLIGII